MIATSDAWRDSERVEEVALIRRDQHIYFWPTNEKLSNAAHQPERNMAVAASREASQSWLLSLSEAIKNKQKK